MNILFLNWRDITNPKAGGAEVVTQEIAKRWVKWGHKVTLFTAAYPNCKLVEEIDGVTIIRYGGQVSVRFHAMMYYLKNAKQHFDIVIDEINTIPFFTPLYVRTKKIAYFNQLARRVWFYETKFPYSLIGYLIEPFYLQFYRWLPAMVISESTKNDLARYGFNKHNITVFSMAIDFIPVKEMPKKERNPTIIYVGRVTPSKRVHEILDAFAILHKKQPKAKFWIIGRGEEQYKQKLITSIAQKNLKRAVTFWGFVDAKQKRELMGKAHVIAVASIKEGWGLIVTEANACGTVAAVYDIDGLRDSVQHNKTGLIAKKNTPQDLARQMNRLITDKVLYKKLQTTAHKWSGELTWDRSAKESLAVVNNVVHIDK